VNSRSDGPAESIGARLRRLRLERGLSQRQLASRGVSYAYISRIESGQRTPSVRAIRLLARRLGVAPEYLESGADIGPVEALELRLTDAELRLRLGDHSGEVRHALQAVLKEAQRAGESEIAMHAQIALGLSSLAAGNEREAAQYLAIAVDSPIVTPRMTMQPIPIHTLRPMTTGATSLGLTPAPARRRDGETGWFVLSKIATSPAISVSSPMRTLWMALTMLR